MAVSKVDAANQIENQLPQANIATNVNFRNILINGDMSLAQRGTSFTGLGNGDNETYTLDRFAFSESGAPTGECTITQDSDVPSGQGFAKSFKVDITTADTAMAAADLLYINTKFEGQNLQYLNYGNSSAKKLTLSFWVKSNVTTGNFAVSLYNQDPSTARVVNLTYSINSADTWEKKTFTIDGETISGNGFDNDNTRSLWLSWIFAAGTDWTSGTQSDSWHDYATSNFAAGQTANLFSSNSNEWYITGVQLEAGEVASDFEFLPFDVNLRRCQRYFFKSYAQGTAIGTSTNVNAYFQRHGGSGVSNRAICIEYATEMRAVPSITSYSLVGTSGAISDCGTGFSHSADRTVSGYAGVGTKRMGGYSVTSGFDAVQASHIVAEAEL